VKTFLRRWLLALLAEDICTLIQAALDDAEIKTFLDGEEVSRIARQEIARNNENLSDVMNRSQGWT
jgi:hypothetical protein